jgi:hypothetical protein
LTFVERDESQEDIDGDSGGEDHDEHDEDSDDEEDEEDVEKPRKRAKKTPPAQSIRRSSAAKANGVAKASKGRKPKKRQSGPVDAPETLHECPILGK